MERITVYRLPCENDSPLLGESTDLSPEIERELVLKAKEGDTEAFGQIYGIHRERVYRHLVWMIRDHHSAEDLTAETFLNAFSAISRFVDREVPIRHWLLKIAHNEGISYLRSKKIPCLAFSKYVEDSDGDKTANDAEMKIMAKRANDLIASLPDDQAVALRMKLYENKEYPEIAEVLGKREGAVRVLTHRGLKKVREDLRHEFSADNSEEKAS